VTKIPIIFAPTVKMVSVVGVNRMRGVMPNSTPSIRENFEKFYIDKIGTKNYKYFYPDECTTLNVATWAFLEGMKVAYEITKERYGVGEHITKAIKEFKDDHPK